MSESKLRKVCENRGPANYSASDGTSGRGGSSPNATHVEMLKIAGKDKVRTKYLKELLRLKDVHIK